MTRVNPNSASTPSSRSNSLDEKSSSNFLSTSNLFAPSATSAFGYPRGLNNDSPPLTPTSETDRTSHEFISQESQSGQGGIRLIYQTAKHQWSAAQANADAAGLGVPTDYQDGGISRSWALSPPLTSSSRSSPVQSLRAFTPNANGVRSISTPTPFGLLPSHLNSIENGSHPEIYDYHPGKSPPPTNESFENQPEAITTATSTNITSNRLRFSLESLIPKLSSRRRSTSAIQTNPTPWKLPPLRPHLPTLLSILILLMFSTISITMALSTLPLRLPRSISGLTLSEIRELCSSLKTYAESSSKASLHTLSVMSLAFVFLHTFNVPGSLLLNILFGATFGTFKGTIYTSLLTAIGGTGCYLICQRLSPIIKAFPGLEKPLNAMRKALNGKSNPNPSHLGRRNSRIGRNNSSSRRNSRLLISNSQSRNSSPSNSGRNSPSSPNVVTFQENLPSPTHIPTSSNLNSNEIITSGSSLWSYLLLLRVLPIVPYGIMNVASGVLGVPILPFFGTLGVGSIPWNAVTAQSGELLLDIALAVSEGFEDLTSQIPVKLNELDLISNLNVNVDVKEVKKTAQGGLKIILKRIWKKEMLMRLGLLTLIVLAPILIASWLKRRKEQKEIREWEERRLIEECDEEVLDEEEGLIGTVEDQEEFDEKDIQAQESEGRTSFGLNRSSLYEDPEEMSEKMDDGMTAIPQSASSQSGWSRFSWNSQSGSKDSLGEKRFGHHRQQTDG